MEFYEEMQAFKMQQQYIQKAAEEYGEAALPENSRWLVNASDEKIASEVTLRYKVSPDPDVGITAPLTDELVGKMFNRTMKGVDVRRDAMRRLEEKLPNE